MVQAMKNEIIDYPEGVAFRPVHPGRTLAAELASLGLSADALALKLRVPATRVSDIVRRQRAISAETALRFGCYFGTGAEFWMNLKANYDLARTRQELGEVIEREIGGAAG